MTRAQGLRSSKRKPVISSKDNIPEYCKENSPSILSQNSRRAVQARKNAHDCKENILPVGSKRKPVSLSQDIISKICKETSPSILSQKSRRAARVKKIAGDCKENVLPKCSKRKPVMSSQDSIPEFYKENSPFILSQNSSRATRVKKIADDSKNNVLPKGSKCKPVMSSQDSIPEYCRENSPFILSQNSKRAAQVKKNVDNCEENVLLMSSKRKPETSSKNIIPETLNENLSSASNQNSRRAVQTEKKSDEYKENLLPKRISSSFKLPSSIKNQELYSPIRKSRRRPNVIKEVQINNNSQCERRVLNDTTNSFQAPLSKNNIFHKIVTVPQSSTTTNNDENHIPVYKTVCPTKPWNGVERANKKKEAVYEFEVDENEEPAMKKKRKKRAYTRKPKIGPKALTINNIKYSSTESLASLPDNPIGKKQNTFVRPNKINIKPCLSVVTLNDSCVSVPSVMSHPTRPLRENICELSVLQETQSEQSSTPEPMLPEVPIFQSLSSSSSVPATLSRSHHIHFSPNPRCYGSKSGQTPNPYNDDLNNDLILKQAISVVTNVSTSSRDFLSSTPCKRFSLVVRDNSVFDDSPGMRSNTGTVQDSSSFRVADDNCFGFDEPEELEEPLVSPIKGGIDLPPKRASKCVPIRYDWEEPKPSIQEVIELLKANIPKPSAKKDTTMFVTSPQSSEPTSPTIMENDSPVFLKPARRSYERQRRVQYYNSDSEEEEEETVEEIKIDTTSTTKKDNKCYKKANSTKTVRAPKVTKAKQRIAKEEEELEKMAALMNAQFQKIDKVDLVVE